MTTLKQLKESKNTHEVTFHKDSSLGGNTYNVAKLRVSAKDDTDARNKVHGQIAHMYPSYRVTNVKKLEEAKLSEGTFDVTSDKPLNPKPAKLADKEYKSKAKRGIHSAQPVTMFDAGHIAGHPVGESRGHSIISRKLKTMEFLKQGLPKQRAEKPEEPAEKPKEQFTPPKEAK